jgi:CBS-domain-containing membrane protein
MELTMRAHQIMTRPVITVTSDTTIVEAAKIMLKHHGLPVVDATGNLTGIVSEDGSLHRSKIGTQRRPGCWLDFIFRPEQSAIDYIRQHGRKISEIMASVSATVTEDTPLPTSWRRRTSSGYSSAATRSFGWSLAPICSRP